MNIRHIYQLCEICNYLKIYIGCFDIRVFKSFKIIIHGFILTEGIFFFSKTSRQMVEKKSKQAFSYLINKAKFSIEKIQSIRIANIIKLAAAKKKAKYNFFIVDDTTFKKKKHKKTQGASINYCSEVGKSAWSQCIVMSSFIFNNIHVVYKSMVYVGEKYIAPRKFKKKTVMCVNLLTRFSEFVASSSALEPNFICLIDGGYTCSMVMHYLANSSFIGFIGRYSKGRNIYLEGQKILLKTYIQTLTIADFEEILVDGSKKLIKKLTCGVKGLDKVTMVLVIDDVITPSLKDIRPLITNILELTTEEIIKFYARRWVQETYHQVIKDALGFRRHKIQKLSAFMIVLELLAVCYTLLEIRRVKYYSETTVFQVRNDLMNIAKKCYILNLKGNKVPKSLQEKHLLKFCA